MKTDKRVYVPDDEKEFTRGFLMAAALVANRDESVIAGELLRAIGVTTNHELRRCRLDEFDAEPLRKVIQAEFRPPVRTPEPSV